MSEIHTTDKCRRRGFCLSTEWPFCPQMTPLPKLLPPLLHFTGSVPGARISGPAASNTKLPLWGSTKTPGSSSNPNFSSFSPSLAGAKLCSCSHRGAGPFFFRVTSLNGLDFHPSLHLPCQSLLAGHHHFVLVF